MVVPQNGTNGRGLVSRERVSERRSRGGLIRRLGRRRAPLRRRLTAASVVSVGCVLSRRRRRDADVGDVARCGDDAPARRGNANRIGAAHQSDFVHAEPHQDTHQEAHQKAVSAGHSVAPPSASKRRARSHQGEPVTRLRFRNVPIGRSLRVGSRRLGMWAGSVRRRAHEPRVRERSVSPVTRSFSRAGAPVDRRRE